ncbi:hypothetical protein BC332_20722 [Capsicum chinense]|nr:hypothetical protein BC332_20722 [Capsicum chinense]
MKEENNLARLGGSLPVPSVQELAKGSLENVPLRYLRDDQQLPPIMIKSDDNIPIINVESLLLGDEFEFKKLDSACRQWGFFQLINHGVSDSLIDKVKKDTQDFFNLPLEDKKKLSKWMVIWMVMDKILLCLRIRNLIGLICFS